LTKFSKPELKSFLEEKYLQYNTKNFIDSDPIRVPHTFSQKNDIEISSFLTSIISWGNRKIIIRNAFKLMELMDNAPHDFIINHEEKELEIFNSFVHRTFNSTDLKYFITSLKNIYINHGGLEKVLSSNLENQSTQKSIHMLKKIFFQLPHQNRTRKHIADPLNGSSAKRINMFLRWMVRTDPNGVDFGIWKNIPIAYLSIPLDVHTGNISRKLGLLTRKQNDAKALQELDINLRKLDPLDPVKYDYALFGLGVFESF
jgi:uncharacterized protein (TIGR02757 family)